MNNWQALAMLIVFWSLGIQTGRRLERDGKKWWQLLD